MLSLLVSLFLLVLSFPSVYSLSYSSLGGSPYTVSYDSRSLLINGTRSLFMSGAIHYPRSAPTMWPELIDLAANNGLNMIESYIFWNFHSVQRGQYDFSSPEKDIKKFVELIGSRGMFAMIRIGPYVCAEWNWGGIPAWMKDDGAVWRTNDPVWEREMASFVDRVIQELEPYMAKNGGPIAVLQIENEYGNVDKRIPGHEDYIKWAIGLTKQYATGAQWIMCQQNDHPANSGVISSCNGFYCHQWIEGHAAAYPTEPAMWTENWVGWFQDWGEPTPKRPVEDIAYAALRFIAQSGSLVNYYMFHGGTNFARTAGGPTIITSYDYDAPIDEFGVVHAGKYYHLQAMHQALFKYENFLMESFPSTVNVSSGVQAFVYGQNSAGIAFVVNSNVQNVSASFSFCSSQSQPVALPAWSVLLVDLSSCSVVFNSAVKQPAQIQAPLADSCPLATAKPSQASVWSETVGSWSNSSLLSRPLEQIIVTRDVSDYLQYSTTIQLSAAQIASGSLSLILGKCSDFALVFLDSSYVASSFDCSSQLNELFNVTIKLSLPGSIQPGAHQLTIVSQTIGLNNYGAFMETIRKGLIGAIAIASKGQPTVDLSILEWSHQTGIQGEAQEIYAPQNINAVSWNSVSLSSPVSAWSWYQLMIVTPSMSDICFAASRWHIELPGFAKGFLYINGRNAGRYWDLLSSSVGFQCDAHCSYIGGYSDKRCRVGCGGPVQAEYHVPQSWLNPPGQPNIIVVWSELPAQQVGGIALVQRPNINPASDTLIQPPFEEAIQFA